MDNKLFGACDGSRNISNAQTYNIYRPLSVSDRTQLMLFTVTLMTQTCTLTIRYNFLITNMVVRKVTTGAQTVKGGDSVGSDKDKIGVSCLQSDRGTSSLKRGWYSWETVKWIHLT